MTSKTMTTERGRRRTVAWALLAGALFCLLGMSGPAAASGTSQPATPMDAATPALGQPPDDRGEGEDDPEEDAPEDEGEEDAPEDEGEEDAPEDEPAPEPGNVPVIVWVGAAALVLAAIALAVNVARD